MNYHDFIERKTHIDTRDGFKPTFLPDSLFDFQKALVEWSVEHGRSAIFADCGLGKSFMQLAWAQNVIEHTNRPVLVLTPLAVGPQTVREGETFGIESKLADPKNIKPGIHISNYERLHYYDPHDFSGVVCDESSILKNFDGKRKAEITEFMRKTKYRLLCTATAAPNDYTELGTSSEALGWLGMMDMLGRFFVNQNNTIDTRGHWKGHGAPRQYELKQWRFKGHAEEGFWKWVCSWARAVRKPSDLGFSDEGFDLPPLNLEEHVVEARTLADGVLFDMPAAGLQEQKEEQKRTVTERCEKTAELCAHDDYSLIWCHLNAEADLLERLIPGAVQVSGGDSDEQKERKLLAFADGHVKKLITKPKIGAWGLNYQHCAHETYFPSHSYEQFYQGVRRCWRFGQKRPVKVDIITTEGGRGVLKNLQRKSDDADKMFARLVAHMTDAMHIERSQEYTEEMEVPQWL